MSVLKKKWLYILLFLGTTGAFIWAGFTFRKDYLARTSYAAIGKNWHLARVGVIDVQKVKRESKIFQRLSKIIEDKHKIFHEEILAIESKLRAEHEQLIKETANADTAPDKISSQKEAQARKKEFEQRVVTLEKLVEQKRKQLQEFMAHAYGEIEQKVQESIKYLSDINGYHLILDGGLVLYSAENNITNDMIKLLDEKTQNLYNDAASKDQNRK